MARDEDSGQRPCSRIPAEWCDGSRIITGDNGTIQRLPGLTYRTFCDPCEARITTCLDELPSAFGRLAEHMIDPTRGGGQVIRVPFGPRLPLSAETDALMRRTAAILGGWAARVRSVPGLQLTGPEHALNDPRGVAENCEVMALHSVPLLALQDGWMIRIYPLPEGRSSARASTVASTCRRCRLAITRSPVSGKWWVTDVDACPVGPCGKRPGDHLPGPVRQPAELIVIPADLEEQIGDEEIVQIGDTWIKVMTRKSGADAGNEILDLHYRARKILGETKTPPESFDGIPCRACDQMALERAEPPSDPDLPAMHSRCAACRDEMNREDFAQWADRYAAWARGAGVKVCRRCALKRHEDCCWHACSCAEGEHPRRRAAA